LAGDPQERFACAGQLAAQLRCLKEAVASRTGQFAHFRVVTPIG
jgi:hypothetical protein